MPVGPHAARRPAEPHRPLRGSTRAGRRRRRARSAEYSASSRSTTGSKVRCDAGSDMHARDCHAPSERAIHGCSRAPYPASPSSRRGCSMRRRASWPAASSLNGRSRTRPATRTARRSCWRSGNTSTTSSRRRWRSSTSWRHGRRDAGDEMTSAWCGALRISVAHLSGRPGGSTAAGRARRSPSQSRSASSICRPSQRAFMAGLLADVGRFEDSKATAEEGLRLATGDARRGHGSGPPGGYLVARNWPRATSRRRRRRLDGLPEEFLRDGSSPAERHCRPGRMRLEALIGLGELDRATALQESFDDLAARSSRWARCTAARCRGLLQLARGDDTGAVAELELSLKEEGGTYPLERGRTLTALGDGAPPRTPQPRCARDPRAGGRAAGRDRRGALV